MQQQYKSHKNNFEWKKPDTKEHNIYDSIYLKVEKQAKINYVFIFYVKTVFICQDSVYS